MNNIVVDLGFGDCGKGITTSFLCEKIDNPIVVRFSGGSNAGHTVIKDGFNHVFSNFGSGTLQEIPTYWSEYCTFCPLGVYNEYKTLEKYNPILYVHPLCPVITPYDMTYNQHIETINQHGSCGVGLSATINRQEKYYKLFVQDLFYPNILKAKLENIKKFYNNNVDDTIIEIFLGIVNKVINIIKVSDTIPHRYNKIYEGAQGILLDMDFGFFPNVTRSNTTSKNAISIYNKNHSFDTKIDVNYVTRTYQTRHGNGYMTNEKYSHLLELKNNESETNVNNKWQGVFRKTILDIDLLNYSLECDSHFSKNLDKNLVITCVDQINRDSFYITEKNKLKTISIEELPSKLKTRFNKIYISEGNTIKTFSELIDY